VRTPRTCRHRLHISGPCINILLKSWKLEVEMISQHYFASVWSLAISTCRRPTSLLLWCNSGNSIIILPKHQQRFIVNCHSISWSNDGTTNARPRARWRAIKLESAATLLLPFSFCRIWQTCTAAAQVHASKILQSISSAVKNYSQLSFVWKTSSENESRMLRCSD